MCCALSSSSPTPKAVGDARFKTGWPFRDRWHRSSVEQNTEQEFILGFPYKTSALALARSKRLSLWPALSRERSQMRPALCFLGGFCFTLGCVRAACLHPAAPHKPGFQAAPKALRSLKSFVLGFFFLFFLACQSNPDNAGCKAGQPSAVLCTLPFPHR